jgi:hypothetical protein
MPQKRLRFTLFFLLISFLMSFTSVKSQNDKFPIGLFSANSADPSITSTSTAYYNLMKELGANWLIIQPDTATKQRYKTDGINIISLKDEKVNEIPNYIYHYTGGYYKKWCAKDGIPPSNKTGLKQHSTVGTLVGNYWTSINTQTLGVLLDGPNYRQDKIYRNGIDQYAGLPIVYTVKIRYKLDEIEVPPLKEKDVCKIFVEYKYDKDGPLTKPLKTEFITTNDATGEFLEKTFTYNLSYFTDTYGDGAQKLIENGDIGDFNDNGPGHGLNIELDYLGESKIYIDYIEVYDNQIGVVIRDEPSTVSSNINDYITAMSSRLPSTFKYWYSLDEPQTIDNYYPYNFVNNILKNTLSSKPIITTYYPTWGGIRNGDSAITKFIEEVEVDQFMYYYYPIFLKHWDTVYKVNGSIIELNVARAILQQAHLSSPNFWYTVQAHGFINKGNWDKRTPHPNELSAQVMLGLAHGAKGIFYYNFYSYQSGTSEHFSLLDLNYNRSDRFIIIRDELKPRFEGEFGRTLLNLDYTGDFIRYYRSLPLVEATVEFPENNYLTISEAMPSTHSFNYHIGLMEETNKPDNKHFLIANLICPPGYNRTARLTISDDYNFTNIGIKNIGESYSNTFNGNNQFQFDLIIPPGDGYLFQVAPVLKYGGNLVYDDTVNAAITLSEPMTIKPNADLVVEALYNIASDIYVEDGGTVKTQHPGGITFSNVVMALSLTLRIGVIV